ncbi:hypothetical protein [Leclercia adecarboxylata]|uniref:hypothetical protein n=1 Tax=Leclercia adecarboxylata TaxID=83655 RepID=UPI0011180880|nr:hypothetical protein [Leclercia adecarboxylata]QCZ30203.1 hypothetical protein FHN83_26930 [Leclercia adecarboxylata]
MAEFTNEQLAEYAKGCIEYAKKFQDVEIARKETALFEMALAALETAPHPAPDLRDVFETWAKSECWNVERGASGHYVSMSTHDAWTVVNACSTAMPQLLSTMKPAPAVDSAQKNEIAISSMENSEASHDAKI